MPAAAAPADILQRVHGWRHHRLSIGYASGAWDLLHAGHLAFLQAAHERCHRLIVGVTSDAIVRRAKGPGRPIVPAGQRAQLIAALRCVDAAFIFDAYGDDPNLEQIRPDIFFRGADYAGKIWHEEPTLQRLRIRSLVLLTPRVGTSELLENLQRIHHGGTEDTER